MVDNFAFSQTVDGTPSWQAVADGEPSEATSSPDETRYSRYRNDDDAERAHIWNSPRMIRARRWLRSYCARSAQISPQEARQYLAELRQLTPNQMRLWLLAYERKQASIDNRHEYFDEIRQASVARAIDINQSVERAYRRIGEASSMEARYAQESIESQQRMADATYLERVENSAAAARAMYEPDYGPFSPLYGRYWRYEYDTDGTTALSD